MKPIFLVVAAGLPSEIGERFVKATRKFAHIISWLPLNRSVSYSNSYSADLYSRLALKLRTNEKSTRQSVLAHTNLVLMYLDKCDGSESRLFRKFGMETLPAPLRARDILDGPLTTGNQKGYAVNCLRREADLAIRHARSMLGVIAEEVTNRDNKTCLLLPQKNFGSDVCDVIDCVYDAARTRMGIDEFKKKLRRTSQSLSTVSEGKRKYFRGKGKLVFRCPPKAASRHGMAPSWRSIGHKESCVIRGRLRFGASFDPTFHYDCQIPKKGKIRTFPSCHGTKRVCNSRSHVNIAPNDNVR